MAVYLLGLRPNIAGMNKIIKEATAPSGFIRLYNYKEPLADNPKPYFGFQGTILHDSKENLIQCSVCGEWFGALAVHLKQHKLTASTYKTKFGLSQETALISEGNREAQVRYGLREGYKKLLSKGFEKGNQNWRKRKRRKTMDKISMEERNNRGTCPLQLLDKLQKIKQDLGYQPSYNLIQRRYSSSLGKTVIRVFGSWNNAVKQLGWTVKKPGNELQWSDKGLIKLLRQFKKEHNRIPTSSDVRRGMLPAITTFVRHFGGFRIAKELAYNNKYGTN